MQKSAVKVRVKYRHNDLTSKYLLGKSGTVSYLNNGSKDLASLKNNFSILQDTEKVNGRKTARKFRTKVTKFKSVTIKPKPRGRNATPLSALLPEPCSVMIW